MDNPVPREKNEARQVRQWIECNHEPQNTFRTNHQMWNERQIWEVCELVAAYTSHLSQRIAEMSQAGKEMELRYVREIANLTNDYETELDAAEAAESSLSAVKRENEELREAMKKIGKHTRAIDKIAKETWPSAEFTRITELTELILRVQGTCSAALAQEKKG